jgi:hypothetical protein
MSVPNLDETVTSFGTRGNQPASVGGKRYASMEATGPRKVMLQPRVEIQQDHKSFVIVPRGVLGVADGQLPTIGR